MSSEGWHCALDTFEDIFMLGCGVTAPRTLLLNFCLGFLGCNAVTYVLRALHEGIHLIDLPSAFLSQSVLATKTLCVLAIVGLL